jgi:hypothetical protein
MFSFDRFIDIKEIDEGATWINDKSKLVRFYNVIINLIHYIFINDNLFKNYSLKYIGMRLKNMD